MINTRRLLTIMTQLRDPDMGCPWDRKQNFRSLVPYLLEEAHEVIDAIDRNDTTALQDELGDLLFQIVFHSQIAEENALFDFESVAGGICDKLTRRHPHVFGDAVFASDKEREQAWEDAKASERRDRNPSNQPVSVLDGITASLPALMVADKLQSRAASHGFDWPEVTPVFEKVEEELGEVREALESGDKAHIREEIGDLLFVVVNLARHLGVEPETALKQGNGKFTRRFHYIEQKIVEKGKVLDDCSLNELDALWDEAKEKLIGMP